METFVGEPVGGRIFINPGTGPVENANADEARRNVAQFVAELGLTGVRIRRARKIDYGDGRYAFWLSLDGRRCEIQMPGLPLERVRYLDRPQNPWHYPRLYVDGSSWLWCFALNCAKGALLGEE